MPPPSTHRLVPLLFVAVSLLMVGQLLLRTFWKEPWPAILLPAFENRAAATDGFTIQQPLLNVFFADHTQTTLSVDQFLAPFPRSHRPHIMRLQFSGAADNQESVQYRRSRWVHRRLRTLFSSQPPTHLQVTWQTLVYDVDNLTQPPQVVPTDTVSFVF